MPEPSLPADFLWEFRAWTYLDAQDRLRFTYEINSQTAYTYAQVLGYLQLAIHELTHRHNETIHHD